MAATLGPFAPPEDVVQGVEYQLMRRWTVAGPAEIGPVRRDVTRLLASGFGEDLTRERARIGDHVAVSDSDGRPLGLADLRNRVALVCSELVTNAVRHGDPPVLVALLTDGDSWLLDVSDSAVERLPDTEVERPLGQGGYGLMLIARLSSHMGWFVKDDRKHVWAMIELGEDNASMEDITGNVSSLTEGQDEVRPL